MTLLLDGYNILKKIKRSSYISDAERQKFIKQLNNYAHQKNLYLVIVFDGGPFTWTTTENMSLYIQVTYSGTKETADDYIKRYLDDHQGKDILLVSSDRELVNYAHNRHFPSLDSHEFAHFLHTMENLTQPSTIKNDQKTHKITQTTHEELDILMHRLKVNPIKNENELNSRIPKQKSEKLSKKERKILQKIKKL